MEIDGEYYHVDPALCAGGDLDGGFLVRDELMWENCRWDVSAYPPCSGELSWYALQVRDGLIEPEAPAGETEAEPENAEAETTRGGVTEAEEKTALPADETEEIKP